VGLLVQSLPLLGLLGSQGELSVAQAMGRVPRDIDARQWQLAGAAFQRWDARWRMPGTWTPEQLGRAVRGAAELQEGVSAGSIAPGRFTAQMSALVRRVGAEGGAGPARGGAVSPSGGVGAPARPGAPPPELGVQQRARREVVGLQAALQAHRAQLGAPTRAALNDRLAQLTSVHRQEGGSWDAPTRARFAELSAQARAALAQPLAGQRGAEAVRALGRAIRAHGEAPGPGTRAQMNHALAWARSLHRSEAGGWTPATRADWAVYGPQAERALGGGARAAPGAPPQQASRTHGAGLREANDQSGEAREARERERWRQAHEQAEAIRRQERARVKLRAPTDAEQADRTARIADPWVRDLLQAGPELRMPDGPGAGRAPRAGAGNRTLKALTLRINTLVYRTIEAQYSPDTATGQENLGRLLANRFGEWVHQGTVSLPGAPAGMPPMPVSITVRREPGQVVVQARLHPALSTEALTRSLPYFKQRGLSAIEVAVEHRLPLQDGRIEIRLPGRSGPARADPTGPTDPWAEWRLPNATRNLGLPSNFFDPTLTLDRLMRELPVERPGEDDSWVPDPRQRALMRHLFELRPELEALLTRRHPSHDAAARDLVETLRRMESRSPNGFPAEMNFHVFAATRDGRSWGVGFGAIGDDRSVHHFSLGREFDAGTPSGLGSTSLHTHPTLDAPPAVRAAPPSPGPQLPQLPRPSANDDRLLGPSLQDLIVALSLGQPDMTYDNGVAVRIGVGEGWHRLSSERRSAIVNELDALLARWKALASRARQLTPDRPDSVRATEAIQRDRRQLIDEARRLIARLPVTFDVMQPNPHPERTSGVEVWDVDFASPDQMGTW
jgi:hypothetical protein